MASVRFPVGGVAVWMWMAVEGGASAELVAAKQMRRREPRWSGLS
jgi:hypothetical protein